MKSYAEIMDLFNDVMLDEMRAKRARELLMDAIIKDFYNLKK